MLGYGGLPYQPMGAGWGDTAFNRPTTSPATPTRTSPYQLPTMPRQLARNGVTVAPLPQGYSQYAIRIGQNPGGYLNQMYKRQGWRDIFFNGQWLSLPPNVADPEGYQAPTPAPNYIPY